MDGAARPAVPEITVVVPAMGTEPLGRCLDSLTAAAARCQSASRVLVVWQGAAEPPALPDDFEAVRAFPIGSAYARNRGLGLVRSPLVAFIDSDEVADEGWLAAVATTLADDGLAAVFGSVEPLDDEGLPYCHFTGPPRRYRGTATKPWVGTEGNMAFRTAALVAAGGFDLKFGIGGPARSAEGADVIARLLADGHELAFEPAMRVFHPTKTAAERLASRYPYGFGAGRLVRRHRLARHGTGYVRDALVKGAYGARRADRRVVGEAVRTVGGFAAGAVLPTRWSAPLHLLERLPSEVAAAVGGRPVRPLAVWQRARPHYRYRVGDDLLLHLYAHPAPGLGPAVAARPALVADAARGAAMVPAVVAAASAPDVCWVLEEWVDGRAFRGGPSSLPAPLRYASAIAGPGGPPLRKSAGWEARVAELVDRVPAELRDAVREAGSVVGDLLSVHVHGDFQRKNLLDTAGGVVAIDWEAAEADGIPGHDILFFAATQAGRATAGPLQGVLAGEPAAAPVRGALRSVGVDDVALPAVLLVLLARWWLQEEERLSQLGSRPEPPTQHALFSALAPGLAHAVRRVS